LFKLDLVVQNVECKKETIYSDLDNWVRLDWLRRPFLVQQRRRNEAKASEKLVSSGTGRHTGGVWKIIRNVKDGKEKYVPF